MNRRISCYGKTPEKVQQHGVVAGDLDASKEHLQAVERLGVQRIVLQCLPLEDLEVVARAVL